jgi:hypothetical protein
MPGVDVRLIAGLALLGGACALSGASLESNTLGSRFTPSHGEITRVPGFDGPLPSRRAGATLSRRARAALSPLPPRPRLRPGEHAPAAAS